MSDEQKVDYLKEDPPIADQNWIVLSFVVPKNMMELKNLYYINKFLISDVNKSLEAQATQMVRKLNATIQKNMSEVLDRLGSSVNDDDKRVFELMNTELKKVKVVEDDYVQECRRNYKLDEDELLDKFRMFKVENYKELDRDFDAAHDNQTSICGIKCRGVFKDFSDAQIRAKMLREEVEPAHHAFAAPMFKWVPWNPDADAIQDQDYMLDQLGDLMGKYHSNIHKKNVQFAERTKAMKEDANKQNAKNIRERLREKLIEKQNRKLREDLEKFMNDNDGTGDKERTDTRTDTRTDAEGAEMRVEGPDGVTKKHKKHKNNKHKNKNKTTIQQMVPERND